jgi:hypothetical protein
MQTLPANVATGLRYGAARSSGSSYACDTEERTVVLSEALRGKLGPVDISAVSSKIEALLDEKIEGVAITAPIIEGDEAGGRVDLSSCLFAWLLGCPSQDGSKTSGRASPTSPLPPP